MIFFNLGDKVPINEATDDSYSMAEEGDKDLDISKSNRNQTDTRHLKLNLRKSDCY